MIILEKRKIIMCSLLIFLSVFALGVTTNRTENTVQTVALPVTNKVIVLDARTWSSR